MLASVLNKLLKGPFQGLDVVKGLGFATKAVVMLSAQKLLNTSQFLAKPTSKLSLCKLHST